MDAPAVARDGERHASVPADADGEQERVELSGGQLTQLRRLLGTILDEESRVQVGRQPAPLLRPELEETDARPRRALHPDRDQTRRRKQHSQHVRLATPASGLGKALHVQQPHGPDARAGTIADRGLGAARSPPS